MAIINRIRSIVIVCLIGVLIFQLRYGFSGGGQANISSTDDLLGSGKDFARIPKKIIGFDHQDRIFQKLQGRVNGTSDSGGGSDGSSPDDDSSGDDSDAYEGSSSEADLDTPATDDQWNDLVNKGSNLLALLGMSVDAANNALQNQGIQSQSQFTDYSNLQDNGWDSTNADDEGPFKNYIFMSKALSDLELSQETVPNGGTNNAVQWTQDRGGNYKGQAFDQTGGRYLSVYNPTQGVIIALQSYSPKFPENPPPNSPLGGPPRLPPLQQWSDVTFLEWQHEAAGSELQGLQYIFRNKVDNVATRNAISRALQIHSNSPISTDGSSDDDEDSQLDPPAWYPGSWPGVTFSTGSDEGKALLATPNAAGPAWLLIQHKEYFSGRTISNIQVFEDEDTYFGGGGGICMLLNIVDSIMN